MNRLSKYIHAIRNWMLCKRYPFLRVLHRQYYGRVKSSFLDKYLITFYDMLPSRFTSSFGKYFIRDIKDVLEEKNILDEYVVYDVQESAGKLIWKDNSDDADLKQLINYYTELYSEIEQQ